MNSRFTGQVFMLNLKVHVCSDSNTKPFDAYSSEIQYRTSSWEEHLISLQPSYSFDDQSDTSLYKSNKHFDKTQEKEYIPIAPICYTTIEPIVSFKPQVSRDIEI